jgi:hypothetical protein
VKSGQYRLRIDRREAASIREEFAFAMGPARAKVLKPVPVESEPKSTEHAEFLAAFGALVRGGWTLRAIARHLGVSHRYVIDMRRGHRPARTEACDWVARMWSLLSTTEPELPSSGTWG